MGSVIFKKISGSVQNSLTGLQSCERKPTFLEFYLFFSCDKHLERKERIDNIWKVISCSHGLVISGWLDWFIDLQRNFRFWSNLANRVADLQKKAYFLSVLSFMFCRL